MKSLFGRLYFMEIYPLLAIILWGLSFTATKVALRELDPATLIFLRFSIGGLILGLVLAFKKYPFNIRKSDIPLLFFCGFILFVHILVQVSGMRFTTASNTAWIVATSPVFVALLSYLFLKESFSLLKMGGILVAGLGVMLLVSRGNLESINFTRSQGDLLALVSSITWAVYSIANKRLLGFYSATLITFCSLLLTCILAFPLNLSQQSFASTWALSKTGWLAIAYLGLFCSGIAYLFWSKSLKHKNATDVSVYLYLEPVVAQIGANLILKEMMTLWLLAGGGLIILGVYMVSAKRMPAK